APFDPQDERREARWPANRLGQFLVARDPELDPAAARVGAGEKGAITDVPAGIGQLQARDNGNVLPQGLKRLEDRGDGVVQACVGWGEVAAIEAQAKEAENHSPRRF